MWANARILSQPISWRQILHQDKMPQLLPEKCNWHCLLFIIQLGLTNSVKPIIIFRMGIHLVNYMNYILCFVSTLNNVV